MTLVIILVILLLLCGGGWGYGRWGYGGAPAGYANPMGLIFLILVVILIVWLIRGI